MKKWLKITGYFILIVIALVLCFGVGSAVLYWLTITGYLEDFLDWIGEIGYWGNLVMVGCLLIINLPMTAGYGSLMLASGFLFKFWAGLLTVVVGCQLGVFLVGSFIRIPFFKRKAHSYIEAKPILTAVMEELTLHQLKFSFFLRISPLPLGMQNLILSLSKMTMIEYQLTSFVALLTQQIPIVYIGSTLNSIAQVVSGNEQFSWINFGVILITLFAFVIILIFIGYIGRNVFVKLKIQQIPQIDIEKDSTHQHHSEKDKILP